MTKTNAALAVFFSLWLVCLFLGYLSLGHSEETAQKVRTIFQVLCLMFAICSQIAFTPKDTEEEKKDEEKKLSYEDRVWKNTGNAVIAFMVMSVMFATYQTGYLFGLVSLAIILFTAEVKMK